MWVRLTRNGTGHCIQYLVHGHEEGVAVVGHRVPLSFLWMIMCEWRANDAGVKLMCEERECVWVSDYVGVSEYLLIVAEGHSASSLVVFLTQVQCEERNRRVYKVQRLVGKENLRMWCVMCDECGVWCVGRVLVMQEGVEITKSMWRREFGEGGEWYECASVGMCVRACVGVLPCRYDCSRSRK